MNTSFPDTCKKAFVTEQELFEGLRCSSYEALHARVGELVAQNRLSPVRSSGVNGRVPFLFNRYRIIRAPKSAPSHLHEITTLHPSLHIEGYLAEPAGMRRTGSCCCRSVMRWAGVRTGFHRA
jgi:hypothetical protein